MHRRLTLPVLGLLLVLTLAACTNKRVSNPLANVNSAQPDKVLFDRAMDAMKHNRFDVARMTLQTLINTYPDSEYLARAKLGVGDSWYAAGGSAAMAQAEAEYKDFITFFPNMPEAAGSADEDCQHPLQGDGETGPGLHSRHAGGAGVPQHDPAVPGQPAGSAGQGAAAAGAGSSGGTGVSALAASITCGRRGRPRRHA